MMIKRQLNNHIPNFLIVLIVVFMISSCKTIFKTSPYKSYVTSLETAGLSDSKMAKDWRVKGEQALANPTQEINIPHREEIFFKEFSPQALGYKINYKKGRKYIFTIKTEAKEGFQVFVDLFEKDQQLNNHWSLQSADTSLVYENAQDKILIMRLQPELLISGKVILEISDEPKLGFPVSKAGNKNIQSFWGVDRDGGNRKHEGIDIFSKRGTPILAVEDGTITRVQETNLGGKVVWQRLGLFSQSIYYAHLDSQLVESGQKVSKGDTIGLMGNTGNAITTSPHLHFGIYTTSGAIDPLEYVLLNNQKKPSLKKEIEYLGEEIIIRKEQNIVPANIIAVSSSSVTFENEFGELESSSTINTTKINPILKFKEEKDIYLKPHLEETVIGVLNPQNSYTVLGKKGDFTYIMQNETKGWVTAN